jgi:AraC-like DNA-binding protein
MTCYNEKMKKNIYAPQPLILTEGYFCDKQYHGYEMMSESINNWKQLCPYQLRPDGLSGRHQILQLHSMQIVYGQRKGGTMHNIGSAEECLTIGVVEVCADKACIGNIKLQAGDILFFDDSHPHNFITNDAIQFIIVTIPKSSLGSRRSKLSKALDQCIKDTDARFAITLREIWKRFIESSDEKKNRQRYKDAEEEILKVIMKLLSEQTPGKAKLTDGEKTALEIRDQVFHHMDGNISISSLSKQYKVSEQTLQNSFKSLFGFTPKLFLRLLKLNIVRQELQKNDPEQNTVSKVALKWGFRHMGRFSAYYADLFGEKPSQTLKNAQAEEKGLTEACVSRQEEIE